MGMPESQGDEDMLREDQKPSYLSQIDITKLACENEPDRLLAILSSQSAWSGVLKEATPTQFRSMLSILSPDHMVGSFARIYRDVHAEDYLPRNGIPKLQDVFRDFRSKIQEIFYNRQKAGHILGLPEYTYILDCARVMGDANLAAQAWTEMQAKGVEPDTTCYNYHMAAKSWEDAFVDTERFNLRIVPWYMINRRAENRNRKRGYRGVSTGPGGTKSQVLDLFYAMTAQGIPPDEESYIHLMVGSAREGDLKSCRNILHQIWGISHGVLEGTQEGGRTAHVFQLESPLRPSAGLIMAIAHCWGINNELPAALRIIDFVSTTYSIPVPRSAWQHLLEWTYVLSYPRFGKWKEENSVGFIPRTSPRDLYGILVSEPYDIRPTMPMINIAVRNSWWRDGLVSMLKYMNLGRQKYQKSNIEFQKAYRRFRAIDGLFRRVQAKDPQASIMVPPTEWYRAKRVWQIKRLVAERDRLMIRRWVKLLLYGRRWNKMSGVHYWEREKLQNCLVDWQEFLPQHTRYKTKEFEIEFEPGVFKSFSLENMFPDIKDYRETGYFVYPERRPVVPEHLLDHRTT